MARHQLTPRAEIDLSSIWDYVAKNNPRSADRITDEIVDRFPLLAENPFIGRARTEYDPDLRSYAVSNLPYVIFYFPKDYGVEIVRVLHGSRRLTTFLEQ